MVHMRWHVRCLFTVMPTSCAIIHRSPSFIDYYLTHVNEEIVEVGYFEASEDALNEARQQLDVSHGC